MLNTSLWIAQGFVAIVMLVTGFAKLGVPREKLAQKMHWAATWPRARIKLLGLAEVAGAVGLIVPAATGIAPFLTPLAGACLAILMIGAVRTHQQLGERAAPAIIVLLLCVAIAAGRTLTLGESAPVPPTTAMATLPR
jgi:hypothetical protein